MIRARYIKRYVNFISWYLQLRIKIHFKSIQIQGELKEKDASLLVIANHFSFWDGFLVQYLNLKRFQKKFYFMMLEEQLKKRMFLNKSGGFSISKNPKDLIESINHAVMLLKDKNNMVLIFPQGFIETKYRFPFHFEKGVEAILKRSSGNARVLFIANMIEYYSQARPSLFIYYEQPKLEEHPNREIIEAAYNKFFAKCIEKQKEA